MTPDAKNKTGIAFFKESISLASDFSIKFAMDVKTNNQNPDEKIGDSLGIMFYQTSSIVI
ncbi:MAG: hypothetical protein LBP35_01025 [Candidatus Ancillula trichonymphae]|nr:hypothetical protein [Candidatus Ancillula trichonymphae]